MGVARMFQRVGHTESHRGYSPDCHLNIVGCLLTKRLTKGGGGHMHPRTPLATLLNYILQLFNLYHVMFHSVCFHSFFEDKNVSPQCAKTTNFQACFLARCNYDTLAQKSFSPIPSRAFQRIIYLYFDLLLPGSTESRQKKREPFDPEAESK